MHVRRLADCDTPERCQDILFIINVITKQVECMKKIISPQNDFELKTV